MEENEGEKDSQQPKTPESSFASTYREHAERDNDQALKDKIQELHEQPLPKVNIEEILKMPEPPQTVTNPSTEAPQMNPDRQPPTQTDSPSNPTEQ